MNSLTWFLYWIEVISSLGAVLTIIAVIAAASAAVVFIGSAISIDCEFEGAKKDEIRDRRNAALRKAAPIAGVCAVLACFFPSKGTLYAMAASEVGEKVIKNETVQGLASDATKALQQWIKRQIEPDKKS